MPNQISLGSSSATGQRETIGVAVNEFSRLNYSTLLIASNGTDDIVFWDLPRPTAAEPAESDVIIPVEKLKRIDTLANEVYGDPTLWDVIAEANEMADLPTDMVPGEQIRIPAQSRVVTELRIL